MVQKNRIFYYDFLRAIAIIMVILCHVDGCYEFTTKSLKFAIPLLLNDIGLMGVPIFLMISGALLLNREFTLNDFFKKRFTRIIYPAIFWIILNLIAGILILNWDGTKILEVVLGNPSPFWFIWMLIGVYLFIPVINSFLKEYGLKGFEFFLIIWFITILLETFNLYPFYKLELSYFAGFIGFVVLGYYLDNKKFKLSDRTICFLGCGIMILFTLIHMFCSFYNIPILSPMYHNIIIVFQSIGLYLFIMYLDKISINTKNVYNLIKNNLNKVIVSISVCSYGMFCAHYFIYQYLRSFNIQSIKLLPLLLIVVVFTSWLITFIFSKIPVIREFCGVK